MKADNPNLLLNNNDEEEYEEEEELSDNSNETFSDESYDD